MSRIVDEHRRLRRGRVRARLRAEPALGVVLEDGAGRDDRAQVDGDVVELADRVQRRSVGNREPNAPADAVSQRVIRQPCERDGVHGRFVVASASGRGPRGPARAYGLGRA